MALDFPNSPATGQVFPPTNPQWKWDGAEWAPYALAASALGLSIKSQLFNSSGTYTPTPGMQFCIIECVGPGGGGGSCGAATSQSVGAGGGGGGAWCRSVATAAQIGASQPVTVGLGGSGGAASGNNNGIAGSGNTSVGSLCSAGPGQGGTFGSGAASPMAGLGGTPILAGSALRAGDPGGNGQYTPSATTTAYGGDGGASLYGARARGPEAASSTVAGVAGNGPGGGGAGAACMGVAGYSAGGNGANGVVYIMEFGCFGVGPFTDMAPFEALRDSNMLFNSAMEISQENGNSLVVLSNGTAKYAADQFQVAYQSSTGAFRCQQTTGVAGTPGMQTQYCILLQSQTAMGALGASDFAFFQIPVEGFRFRPTMFGTAGATSVTLAFWMNCPVAGTFCVSLRNGATNRSYVQEGAYTSALGWQYFVFTFPGDTTGTWNKDANMGVAVNITLACGTTYRTTPNAWQAGNFLATSNIGNFFTVTNNTAYLTGVTLTAGPNQPSAAKQGLLYRPYDDDLRIAQRYYEKSFPQFINPVQNSGSATGATLLIQAAPAATSSAFYGTTFKVTKRITPTVTIYNPSAANGQIRNISAGADFSATAIAGQSDGGFACSGTTPSGSAAQQGIAYHWTADARM